MANFALSRPLALLASALALSACGSLIPVSNDQSASASGRASAAPAKPASSPHRVSSSPQAFALRPSEAACIADLNKAGARFAPLPDHYAAPGCNTLGTVQLSALSGDRSQFGVSNIGPVQCGTARVFNAWARFGVDRAARQLLGSPLARIETMGSYSCRNIAGSNRRSAHATAGAIDVSGFVLEDGRRISLSADWDGGTPAEREFLRVVHNSACKRFGTVLGPEYNRAHQDHLHLEGSGAKFCR